MRALCRLAAPLSLVLWRIVLPGGPAAAAAGQAPAAGVRVTYLANEGFLLEAGETSVLVDALFGDGLPEYPVVPAAVRADLEGARGRFADVDLILVSHSHADHFDPAAVARHLRANPGAAVLSTREAVAGLRQALGQAAGGREIVAAHPARGRSELHRLGGVRVRALNLHHGRLPIDNLGFLIDLGGLELLHVGDTSAGASDLRPYAGLLATVDVWLLPDWLLGEAAWQETRDGSGNGGSLVTMHMAVPTAPPAWFGSAGSLEGRVARIREALPEAWVPLEPLEGRDFPAPGP